MGPNGRSLARHLSHKENAKVIVPFRKMSVAESLGFSPQNSPPILNFYFLARMTGTSGYGVPMLQNGKELNPHVNGRSSSMMTH